MLLRSTLVFTAFLALSGRALMAQAGNFEIHILGKPVGKASYTISPAKGGYKLNSRYTFRVGAVDRDFSDEFKYDGSYGYLDGTTSDSNSQRKNSFLPNKARTELSISSFLGGAEPTTFTAIKPAFVILPSFDPGAAQVLLLEATTHPAPENKYNVFLPANGAPSGGGGRRGGGASAAAEVTDDTAMPPLNTAYDAVWIKGRDLTGTLDGKAIAVHTYLLGFGKLRWIFFGDDANNLLQLNVSALHASYIRESFKLDSIAPAAATAPGSPQPPR